MIDTQIASSSPSTKNLKSAFSFTLLRTCENYSGMKMQRWNCWVMYIIILIARLFSRMSASICALTNFIIFASLIDIKWYLLDVLTWMSLFTDLKNSSLSICWSFGFPVLLGFWHFTIMCLGMGGFFFLIHHMRHFVCTFSLKTHDFL